jgi:beta-galactosidase
MESEVWINEHYLGNHPYGYTAFSFDITPYLKPAGQQNTIAVKVKNEGRNSRWYTGSGIYRNVFITVTNRLHIPPSGVFITTPKVTPATATVKISTTVANEEDEALVTLKTRVVDAKGNTVGSSQARNSVQPNAVGEQTSMIEVKNPKLWSPERPYLYKAITEVWRGGKKTDEVQNSFGIRSIEFSASKGFLLNGKSTLMRGGCVHHDNGPLGAMAFKRAEERKVELMKSQGCNAIRTSHNPPSKDFLNACDRLGMMVIDEAFDQWQRSKSPDDYSRFFDEWWKKDIGSIVMNHRNHPSVIIWSIGNEINERADSSGLRIAKELREEVYRLDGTRPITNGISGFWDHPGYEWDTTAAAFALLDIGGYNYSYERYEADHAKFPDRVMAGTESFAMEAFRSWEHVEKHPYVIGDFVWTGMDYMGETGIGHAELDTIESVIKKWPWYNAYCGDIDLIGGKKPQSYFRDIVWRQKKISMLVHAPIAHGHKEVVTNWGWPDEYPSWNFAGEEGRQMQVNVYTRLPMVRLQLNGKTIAEKGVSKESNLTATFQVPYAAGELKAVGMLNGKAVDSIILETTGKPYRVRLTADRAKINANRNDLSFVTAEVVDTKGRVIPDAVVPLRFTISGMGEIAATGNGSPDDMSSFQQPTKRTFRGRALVVVRPTGNKGTVTLQAEGENLVAGKIVIAVE